MAFLKFQNETDDVTYNVFNGDKIFFSISHLQAWIHPQSWSSSQ